MSEREREAAFCENCGVIVLGAVARDTDGVSCEDCGTGFLMVMGEPAQLFEKLVERDMKLLHVAAAERIVSGGA